VRSPGKISAAKCAIFLKIDAVFRNASVNLVGILPAIGWCADANAMFAISTANDDNSNAIMMVANVIESS
jgi:hypothetical protein